MGVEIVVKGIRVSVAMVSYNGEKYIREQLDSILNQLTEEDEVLISDDGSVDNTRNIIEEYQKKDARISLLEGPKRGIKKNIENVLKHCKGEVIFLADQDDIWKAGKVEKVLKIMEQKNVNLVIHDAAVFCEKPEQIFMESFFKFRNARPGITKNIFKNSYIGCCMAFRKEIVEKVLPIPLMIEMHDQWIGILSDFYYGKSVFLREALLFYRRHGENNSGMEHYGIGRMLRNRFVFCLYFIGRILHIC